jgi:TetR/AcrR family transcriptional regulator, upper aerobic nicotinate degradation pathway regulator
MPAARRSTGARRPGVRELAAKATRDSILRAAGKVFAKYGYEGGSVEKISQAAKSYDRMIYYYFGSKEGLYVAVLEETYRRFNEAESALQLDTARPVPALQKIVGFIVSYYREHPDFVTLLNTENLHRGKHIAKAPQAQQYSSPTLTLLTQVLRSGAAAGVFRPEVQARDLYLMIAALGYFYQSNRYTLSAFLGEDLQAASARAHWDAFVLDAVMRTVAP